MKSIGSRLTALYLAAVAGTLMVVLPLGHYLLQKHLVASLDASLRLHFDQLEDRLGPDTGPDEVQSLLAMIGMPSSLQVELRDQWDEPAYRDARIRGEPTPVSTRLSHATVARPDGSRHRTIEGMRESLVIRLALPLDQVTETLDAYTRWAGGIAAAVLIFSAITGHFLSQVALRPVQWIQRAATRISSDNLSERIPVPAAQDEISNLARLLNETFARLESAFEQIKRFSADASHELKTPLSLVRLNLERVILRNQLPAQDRESLQDATEEIHRLDRLIESLLFLSRAEAGEIVLKKETVALTAFIEGFVHDARILTDVRGLTLQVVTNESGEACFDASRMRQVLLNLLSNAIKHTPPGGVIRLHSSLARAHWLLAIEDEGPGVPPDKLTAIFDRFVQLPGGNRDGPETGSGLGLAISQSLVGLHRGKIRAVNREDRSGLRIECELPLSV